MKAFFQRLAAQLKTLRNQVENMHVEAEAELERLETRPGIVTSELEAHTRQLERLESVLECLAEALDLCIEPK